MAGLPVGSVTLLFTDIEGSTRLLHELGDAYAGVLTDHRRLLRQAFEEHHGSEVDTQGDSFFVAFSDARDAASAAAASQSALASHPWPTGGAVRVRMGIHTGEPLVVGDHYVGIDVHRGARIAAAAHGGQVLISERTRELLGDGPAPAATLRELGAYSLKDLPEQERLFQLVVKGLPSSFPPPRVHEDAPAVAGLPDYSLPPADVPCPYKGLVPFEPEDSDMFFGREELVETLVTRLEDAEFLAVVGASGSGKSSLVRAGVVPQLHRDAILFTPGEHPLRELAAHLGDRPCEGVVLVVDQFEEVFTLCRDEDERRLFIEALVDAAKPGGTARVVVVLRADFYGHCAHYPGLASALEEHQALVGPMTEEELRRAIERPAEHAGLVLEPGVVEGILRDVVGEPGVLPLLSHSLLETWRRRSGRMLTLIGYLRSGGVQEAIAKTAETVFQERLTPRQQDLARNSFLRLTELGEGTEDTRRRVTTAELIPRAEEAGEVGEVLRVLADARLVTIGEGTVEVAHEALIRHWPTLRAWLDEDREGRLVHRKLTQAAQEWRALGEDAGALYRGTKLSGASEWAESHDSELNELEREFLGASRSAELGDIEATRRRNRRLRVLVAALALLLIGALAAGAVALVLRQRAQDSATAATAQRLGAQALVEKDLDRSLLLAREGTALDDSRETRGNLLSALVRSPAAIAVSRPLPGRLLHVTAARSGDRLIAANNQNTVALLDSRDGRVIGEYDGFVGEFSRDGRIAAIFGDPGITFVDATTGKVQRRAAWPEERRAFYYSLESRLLALVAPDGRSLTFWDLDVRKPVRRLSPRPGYSFLDVWFAPDGNHFLTVDHLGPAPPPFLLPDEAELSWWTPGAPRPALTIPLRDFFSFGFRADSRALAMGRGDGSVSIYALPGGARKDLNGRHNASVQGVGFAPDGKTLVTTGDDTAAIVWNIRSGQIVETLRGHNGRVFGPAFSRDSSTLYTVSLDGSLMSWDLSGERRLGRPFIAGIGNQLSPGESSPLVGLPNPVDDAPTFDLSPNGRWLAVTQVNGEVVVRDTEKLSVRARLHAVPKRAVLDVAFSPDGRLLATAGVGGRVTLWDAKTWRRLRGLSGPGSGIPDAAEHVRTLAFSPDGATLAAGSEVATDADPPDFDGRAFLWDVRSGSARGAPLEAEGPIFHLAFSPDGATLAAAYNAFGFDAKPETKNPGGWAVAWNLSDRNELYRVDVDGDGERAGAVAFSPDGRLLVTGGGTGEARFFDARTGERRGRSVRAAAGWTLSVDFAPDGKTIATGASDGTVRLFDVAKRAQVGAALPGLDNIHANAAFTPDGTQLFVVYVRGSGFRWEIEPSKWEQHACSVAGRRLSRLEWEQFLPDRSYGPSCQSER